MSKNLFYRAGRGGTFTSMFQSTRPCGARPAADGHEEEKNEFQSTRPCGARPRASPETATRPSFNPRARAGRDQKRGRRGWKGVKVSIHAPVRGATQYQGLHFSIFIVSIHAPVRGATCTMFSVARTIAKFQSTRPCGARQGFQTMCFRSSSFQSTRPCGARPGRPEIVRVVDVSIHAPVRGATKKEAEEAGKE